jgi:hypothetical protein
VIEKKPDLENSDKEQLVQLPADIKFLDFNPNHNVKAHALKI